MYSIIKVMVPLIINNLATYSRTFFSNGSFGSKLKMQRQLKGERDLIKAHCGPFSSFQTCHKISPKNGVQVL